MKHPTLLAVLVGLLGFGFAVAQEKPPIKLPADGTGDNAAKALAASPRHGEWADLPLPDGRKLHCWVVYPERSTKAPVVIVIFEIFGMTDWVQAVTDQLAAEGFIAIAPDLLSGKGPDGGNSDSIAANQVSAAINRLTPEEVTGRLDAARAHAIGLPAATDKCGVVGFCWGGTNAFAYATRQSKLDAAIVYYGTAPTDRAQLEKITCPVLGLYGGDDARVTSTVEATARTMEELKKSFTREVYEGAGHGFLRQQDGRDGANLKAAQQAWEKTIAFLKKHLEAPTP
jgi:carboxymethylenebutenolidase